MAKKYFIITFGCQANEADSERIAGWYEGRGWEPAKDRHQTDELIVNTCSVRESAENRAMGQINNIVKHKKKNKLVKPRIILTGCMTRLGERKLRQKITGVDKIWPLDKFSFTSPTVRVKKDKALVPIMTGCDNFCAYCVVPYARGREWSRPLEEIICEVRQLVKQGYDTVMFLGQNVNSYQKGKKLNAKDSKLDQKVKQYHKKYQNNFAVLLALLNDVKGLKKIKFLTSNPHDLTDGIIIALKLPKGDRYLH